MQPTNQVNPYQPPRADFQTGVPALGEDLPLAEPSTRLWATFIDGLISLPIFLFWVFGTMGADGNQAAVYVVTALAGAAGLALVIAQLYLMSTRGQTLGKKWLGIKMVDLHGQNPGFVRAVVLRSVVNGLLGFVPLYSLVDVLFIFRQDRRCVHDLLAGTKVVDA